MAKPEIKAEALALRKKGKSYSQIKKKLRVSKSTLSLWLRDYPLSKEQLKKLTWCNEARIEKFRRTMQAKRQKRLDSVYKLEKRKWLPLSQREFYLTGLFLYWGEGGKTNEAMVTVSNTDPKVMQFMIYWLVKYLGIKKENITAKMHLYSDMDEEETISFWMKMLGLKRQQFTKSYIKKSTLSGLSYKGFGHGTCNLQVGSVTLKEKIMMGIKAIADYYAKKMV